MRLCLLRLKTKHRLYVGPLIAIVFAIAFTASAADQTAYTLNATVGPINPAGASVTIDPIPGAEVLNAINGNSICLDGTCDINVQDWIVFRVSVLSGDLAQLGLSLLDTGAAGLSAIGMGYFLEGGPVQDGTGLTDTYSANSIASDPDFPVFNFLDNDGLTGITTPTSLALFVAYADGTLPQIPSEFPFSLLGAGAASFMVEPLNGSGAASGPGNFGTPITVIPEPTVGLLLGLGLIMMTAGKGRRHEAPATASSDRST